jgi:hypothetical protein
MCVHHGTLAYIHTRVALGSPDSQSSPGSASHRLDHYKGICTNQVAGKFSGITHLHG